MTDVLQELDEVLENYVNDKFLPDVLDDVVSRERVVTYLYHHAATIRAALELQARVDAGWVLVPREPNRAMIAKAFPWLDNWSHICKTDQENAVACAYTAMVAAALVKKTESRPLTEAEILSNDGTEKFSIL